MPANNSTLRTAYFCALAVAAGIVLIVILLPSFPTPEPSLSDMASRADDGVSQVIVVGGGLAGLTATIDAVKHGASVTIIEKEGQLGGNSAKATSGINGAGTEAQKVKGIKDSVKLFIDDTIASGDGLSKPNLVNTLASNSAMAHEWLYNLGLNLTDVVQLGGHSEKRTHRFPPTADGKAVPVGFTILNTLKKHVENNLKDSVTVKTKCVFKELLLEDGVVVGLKYTDEEGQVQSIQGTVVLTSGGYANDHTDQSLLDKHAPQLAKLPTTNGPWATGDIIKAVVGQNIGVKTILMDKVQVHPTGFIEPKQPNFHTKFLAPEALRGCGAIMLNNQGNRFVNELGRRDYVTDAIFKGCKPYEGIEGNPIVAAMLMSQDVIDKFGAAAAGFYKFKGLIQDVASLEGAANKLGVDPLVLHKTIDLYNEAAEKGGDEFGKKVFPVTFPEEERYYLAFITPSLHYCMGGLEISENAEVLNEGSKPVLGLFAAGEVSGGVHGNNRLGGNSLLECVVFGRIAGQHAAHFAGKHKY